MERFFVSVWGGGGCGSVAAGEGGWFCEEDFLMVGGCLLGAWMVGVGEVH